MAFWKHPLLEDAALDDELSNSLIDVEMTTHICWQLRAGVQAGVQAGGGKVVPRQDKKSEDCSGKAQNFGLLSR